MANEPVLFDHPHPTMQRSVARVALALAVVMLLAALAQMALPLLGVPAPLFVLSGLVTLALIAPVLMLAAQSPPVAVSPAGIELRSPAFGTHLVPWAHVVALRDDPLLPPAGAETARRAAVGRARYRPAEGRLLVMRGLPLPYRCVGLFAGEGFTSCVRLGSRTHQGYIKLVLLIERYTDAQRER